MCDGFFLFFLTGTSGLVKSHIMLWFCCSFYLLMLS